VAARTIDVQRRRRRALVARGRAHAALLLAVVALAACEPRPASDHDRSPAQQASVLDDRLRVPAGETLAVDRIVRIGGFAYSGRIGGMVPGLRDGGDGRTLRLVEDGLPLGPPGSLSADVVALGSGRFNHETATRVLFSASDNSDPRRNGRIYRVVWDEPARVLPDSATRTLGLGTTDVTVETGRDRPVSARRLILENTDSERAVRVWGRAAGAPDLTTRDAILASMLRPGMTDEEKALALWSALATWRHHDVAAAAGLEASDPVKLLGVYGFGFCNDVAHALAALLEQAGVRARVVAWNEHTVVEARLDGRWCLLDADRERIYRTRSGQLASVADVFARRATSAFSPAAEVPVDRERFDLAYPRGANRSYLRPLGATKHALRPVLEPSDAVTFDLMRGDHFVDRFSVERPPGWPIRFGSGTLSRAFAATDHDGCRGARVEWPYPIVSARIVLHDLAADAALAARVRGDGSDPWQELRVERFASEASADAAVWLQRGPIRYGLEVRVCGVGTNRTSIRLEVDFQFSPLTLPRVGVGPSTSVWTVEDTARGAPTGKGFAGVRVTQEWDELDTTLDVAAPAGGSIVELERSLFTPDAGFRYATPLPRQRPTGVASGGFSGAAVVALLENGRRLGPVVASDEVAALGGGRFARDGGLLLFSASDGSDPRANGRLYSIVLAPEPGPSPGG